MLPKSLMAIRARPSAALAPEVLQWGEPREHSGYLINFDSNVGFPAQINYEYGGREAKYPKSLYWEQETHFS